MPPLVFEGAIKTVENEAKEPMASFIEDEKPQLTMAKAARRLLWSKCRSVTEVEHVEFQRLLSLQLKEGHFCALRFRALQATQKYYAMSIDNAMNSVHFFAGNKAPCCVSQFTSRSHSVIRPADKAISSKFLAMPTNSVVPCSFTLRRESVSWKVV